MTQCLLFEPTAPAPTEDIRRLRWYQDETIDAYMAGRRRHRRQLAVLATGTGKSVIASTVVARERGRVLVLVNRDELVRQMANHLSIATGGEYVDIEQGQENWADPKSRIVVASVQSLTRDKRLKRFAQNHFDLVIPDEAHRYLATTFRKVLDYFDKAYHLGITATPDRGDEKSLRQIFDDTCYVYDIEDAIDDGFLVPVEVYRADVQDVKLERVKTTAGDFDEEQLDDVMYQAAEAIAEVQMREYPERKSITYWPRIRSAELYTAILNRYQPGSACTVCGKTPMEERRFIIEQFKRGHFQHFVNVDVAVEGFDCPDVDFIGMYRPTKSRARYAQGGGRGTRVLPGLVDHLPGREHAAERRRIIAASSKPNMVLMDPVGNTSRVSLAGPEDMLGGNYSPAEIAQAKKRKAREEYDGLAALKAARERLRRAVNATRVQASVDLTEVDPFRTMGFNSPQSKYAVRFGADPATHGQVEQLVKLSVPREVAENMPRRRANHLIAETLRRNRAGLARYDQLRDLEQWGYKGSPDVEWYQAQLGIAYILDCQRLRQPVDPVVLTKKVMES